MPQIHPSRPRPFRCYWPRPLALIGCSLDAPPILPRRPISAWGRGQRDSRRKRRRRGGGRGRRQRRDRDRGDRSGAGPPPVPAQPPPPSRQVGDGGGSPALSRQRWRGHPPIPPGVTGTPQCRDRGGAGTGGGANSG